MYATKTNFSNEKGKSHQIQLVKYALKPSLTDTLITINLLLSDKIRRQKLISSLFNYVNQTQTSLQSRNNVLALFLWHPIKEVEMQYKTCRSNVIHQEQEPNL